MEEQEIMLRQLEEEQIKQMRENFQVFSCSGSQVHAPECDHECEVESLEGYDLEIAKELVKWDEIGMVAVGSIPGLPLPGIPINTFDLETKYMALIKFLVEYLDVTTEQLDEYYSREKLNRLVATRERNENAIREARAKQHLGLQEAAKPNIILPGGMQ